MAESLCTFLCCNAFREAVGGRFSNSYSVTGVGTTEIVFNAIFKKSVILDEKNDGSLIRRKAEDNEITNENECKLSIVSTTGIYIKYSKQRCFIWT